MAVASLVCAMAFFLWPISSVTAIVLGAMALKSKEGEARPRRRMAKAGLILGCIFLVLVPALTVPAGMKAREAARQAVCMSNLKQMYTFIYVYAQDHKDQMPTTFTELNASIPMQFQQRIHQCPSCPPVAAGGSSYALVSPPANADPTRHRLRDLTFSVIAYETAPNHRGGMFVLFGHGGVRWVPPADAAQALIDLNAGIEPQGASEW